MSSAWCHCVLRPNMPTYFRTWLAKVQWKRCELQTCVEVPWLLCSNYRSIHIIDLLIIEIIIGIQRIVSNINIGYWIFLLKCKKSKWPFTPFKSSSFLLFIFPSLFVELPKPNIKVKSTHWSVEIESKHFAIKTQFLKLLKLLKSLHLFYFVTILLSALCVWHCGSVLKVKSSRLPGYSVRDRIMLPRRGHISRDWLFRSGLVQKYISNKHWKH